MLTCISCGKPAKDRLGLVRPTARIPGDQVGEAVTFEDLGGGVYVDVRAQARFLCATAPAGTTTSRRGSRGEDEPGDDSDEDDLELATTTYTYPIGWHTPKNPLEAK